MNLHEFDIRREAKEEGITQGRVEGARDAKTEAARSLHKNGVADDIIAKSLGLTLEEVHNAIKSESEATEA